MLRRTDALVFVSQGLKEEFLALDPGLDKRCIVVHNGVDVDAFKRRSEQFRAVELFQGSHDVILSIGKFEHRKGHDLLVRAFEIVKRQRSNARLVMIGGAGPTLEPIRLLVSSLGLDEQVTILTNVPYLDIPGLIRRSQVFVLCSRWEKGKYGEGFPLALVESGALARPVVTTNSTGCDEIIQDGQTGRLVAVEDPNALACAMLDLLNNPTKAQKMGMNLHALVCRQFTWRHAWGKYRALIEA
jgi:glycosyltransferase involved in cell wall biosynthesis